MDVTDRVEAVLHEIVDACESMVGLPYDGEPVDQLQHALQTAALARAERSGPELVVAALLHDIARAPAVAGVMYDEADSHHGDLGRRWLEPRVGMRVASLAERHVAAKRYLVATDPAYRDALSPVSAMTLESQGGAMSDEEVAEFEAQPDWQNAVRLRTWDDRAKDPGASVPGLDAYAAELRAVIAAALSAS
jgi:predicted HD phosphohydrolase